MEDKIGISGFVCPVCGEALKPDGKSISCENRHLFDVAKSGYVNLLLSNQVKTRQHGDNKLMIRSRRDFLNRGYYRPLLDKVCEIALKYAPQGCRILDAGCGECWYTAGLFDFLHNNKVTAELLGVDISKDAVAEGAKRCKGIQLAVASVFHLPVEDESCDVILNFFAPASAEEFHRILKDGGVLIRVLPLEKHLWSLKRAIYEKPYENELENAEIEGFTLQEKQEIRGMIHLSCGEDIENVFTMTPYYYKTGEKDKEKLRNLSELDTEIEFGIFVYRK